MALFRLKLRIVENVIPQLIGLDVLAQQLIFVLAAGEHKQVVDHTVQAVGFGFDTFQFFTLTMTAAQQCRGQLEPGERGAQFVGDIGYQPLLCIDHTFKRADHLVKAVTRRKELLRAGFQFRMLAQITFGNIIRRVFQFSCRFCQAPRQPEQQRGADQHRGGQ